MPGRYAIELKPIAPGAKGRPRECPDCGCTTFVVTGTPYTKNDIVTVFVPELYACTDCGTTRPVRELGDPTNREKR